MFKNQEVLPPTVSHLNMLFDLVVNKYALPVEENAEYGDQEIHDFEGTSKE